MPTGTAVTTAADGRFGISLAVEMVEQGDLDLMESDSFDMPGILIPVKFYHTVPHASGSEHWRLPPPPAPAVGGMPRLKSVEHSFIEADQKLPHHTGPVDRAVSPDPAHCSEHSSAAQAGATACAALGSKKTPLSLQENFVVDTIFSTRGGTPFPRNLICILD